MLLVQKTLRMLYTNLKLREEKPHRIRSKSYLRLLLLYVDCFSCNTSYTYKAQCWNLHVQGNFQDFLYSNSLLSWCISFLFKRWNKTTKKYFSLKSLEQPDMYQNDCHWSTALIGTVWQIMARNVHLPLVDSEQQHQQQNREKVL